MTVVTTADTSQLYALCSPTWAQAPWPLTVNELGLDYRIVIATVDDGRRWVLLHPAPSRGKREGRTRGAGAGNAQESPAVRGAGLARGQRRARCLSHARRLDCDGHPAWFVHADWVVPQDSEVFAERASRPRSPPCMPSPFPPPWMRMLIRTPTQARQKVADDVDRVRREFVVNDKRLHRWQRWLDDDSSWPDFSVVVHGDLYVGHCSSTTRSASAG